MTGEELKQAACECLAKAFKGEEVTAHVVQAAVSVLSIMGTPHDPPDTRKEAIYTGLGSESARHARSAKVKRTKKLRMG